MYYYCVLLLFFTQIYAKTVFLSQTDFEHGTYIISEPGIPPAAVHPITGGNAPTIDPGITAKAVIFFSGV